MQSVNITAELIQSLPGSSSCISPAFVDEQVLLVQGLDKLAGVARSLMKQNEKGKTAPGSTLGNGITSHKTWFFLPGNCTDNWLIVVLVRLSVKQIGIKSIAVHGKGNDANI
jgi:hypothetical protein